MRREERGGKCVVVDVSSPTSSCHVVPDEKKLNGKNFSTTNFAPMSSRTLEKQTHTNDTQSTSNLKGGDGSRCEQPTSARDQISIISLPFTAQTRGTRQIRQTDTTAVFLLQNKPVVVGFPDEFAKSDIFVLLDFCIKKGWWSVGLYFEIIFSTPLPRPVCFVFESQFTIFTHTPVRSSTRVSACLEAPLDGALRLLLLPGLHGASHPAQFVLALEVGVDVAAVALFAGNEGLVYAARGARQTEILVFLVLFV